jgi:regulatory protein
VPVVTALRATRRGGVALHVDDEYACVVSESLVARWRLFKGRELSEGDVAEIRAASSGERVMGDAYRLLGHRARSREELRRRLLAKEHDEHAVEAALERLAADGFLDDAAFARSYVADKRHLASWGVERIRRGLRQLGVDSLVVDEALGAGAGDGAEEAEELDRAFAVLRRRGAPKQPLDAARRRAFQALQRRGFSSPVAYAAVRLWVEGEPPRAN